MARHRQIPASGIVIIAATFAVAILFGYFAFNYFNMPREYATAELSLDDEPVAAGARIGKWTRRPLAILFIQWVSRPGNYSTVNGTLFVTMDGAPFKQFLCPARSTWAERRIIICRASIAPAEIPEGRHVLEVYYLPEPVATIMIYPPQPPSPPPPESILVAEIVVTKQGDGVIVDSVKYFPRPQMFVWLFRPHPNFYPQSRATQSDSG